MPMCPGAVVSWCESGRETTWRTTGEVSSSVTEEAPQPSCGSLGVRRWWKASSWQAVLYVTDAELCSSYGSIA